MYVITNRNYDPDATNFRKVFGSQLNTPNDELRLGTVTGGPGTFTCKVYEETPGMALGTSPYPSEKLFLDLQARMRSEDGKNVVFFVHGYNTTFEQAVATAHDIEKQYEVEVILFTWPSDGITHRYKSDKRDAIASHLALDRALERLARYMSIHITQANACGRGFSLLLHSMGNYLFKFLMKSSQYEGETLIFDNVILAAADVNHHDHAEWVSKIQARNRIYVAVNEDDSALAASRLKFGAKQLARLGHRVAGPKSEQAVYLDFSHAEHMGKSHSYFRDVSRKNKNVKAAFHAIFNGGRIEHQLNYNNATGAYEVL